MRPDKEEVFLAFWKGQILHYLQAGQKKYLKQ